MAMVENPLVPKYEHHLKNQARPPWAPQPDLAPSPTPAPAPKPMLMPSPGRRPRPVPGG